MAYTTINPYQRSLLLLFIFITFLAIWPGHHRVSAVRQKHRHLLSDVEHGPEPATLPAMVPHPTKTQAHHEQNGHGAEDHTFRVPIDATPQAEGRHPNPRPRPHGTVKREMTTAALETSDAATGNIFGDIVTRSMTALRLRPHSVLSYPKSSDAYNRDHDKHLHPSADIAIIASSPVASAPSPFSFSLFRRDSGKTLGVATNVLFFFVVSLSFFLVAVIWTVYFEVAIRHAKLVQKTAKQPKDPYASSYRDNDSILGSLSRAPSFARSTRGPKFGGYGDPYAGAY